MAIQEAPDLSDFPFFTGLSPAEVDCLRQKLVQRQYRANQSIFHHMTWQGMQGDCLAVITSGRVILKSGSEDVLNIGPGGVLAQELLPASKDNQYTARAAENTTLWLVRRTDWLRAKSKSLPPEIRHQWHVSSRICWLLFFILIVGPACWLSPAIIRGLSLELTQHALKAAHPEIATDFLQFILRWAPNDADLQEAVGRAYFAQGDLHNAEEHFHRAMQVDPSLAAAQNNLGAALLKQNMPREAIPSLQGALDLNPGSSEAYHNLGVAYLMTSQPENAAALFMHAIKWDPNQAENHFLLGLALETLNRRAEAVVEYQLALTLSRDPELAILARSRLP
jgi:tetratricopeptide (TPR) repeat protein